MVENPDADQATAFDQAAGDLAIFAAWCGVSGRVVVDKRDGGGRFADRRGKDLAGVDKGGREGAFGNLRVAQQAILLVQHGDDEYLLAEIAQPRVENREEITAGPHLGTGHHDLAHQALVKRCRGGQPQRSRIVDGAERGELRGASSGKPAQRAVATGEEIRQFLFPVAGPGAANYQGEYFRISQGVRSVFSKALGEIAPVGRLSFPRLVMPGAVSRDAAAAADDADRVLWRTW